MSNLASHVMPLEEPARRRPEFLASYPVRLRDGAVWSLWVPVVATVPAIGDGGHPYFSVRFDFGDALRSSEPALAVQYADRYGALIDEFARDQGPPLRAWGATILTLTAVCLHCNYLVDAGEIRSLLLGADGAIDEALLLDLAKATLEGPLTAHKQAFRKLPYHSAAEYRSYDPAAN